MTKKDCEYAGGMPVLIKGKRLETMNEDKLESYVRARGVFRRHETVRDILAEETTYMHGKLLWSFTKYPPCEVTGESVEVRAILRKDTGMVTACFFCTHCTDS
jgi:hypothetical protein